ncbi:MULTISPECIES: transposase [unclassified Rhodanobacter]|uniref:transposase n=1 Tax=Rhodanobacter sp. FW104-R8 TaxID=1524464 RepID=UPI0009ED50F0
MFLSSPAVVHPAKDTRPSGGSIRCWATSRMRYMGTYHALRPKYLQRYVSEFCYRFNRRFDLAVLVPRLIVAAARTPPLSYRLATLEA